MLIICPQCSNRLQVDPVMATGKTFRVRCSRCESRFEVDRITGKPAPGQATTAASGAQGGTSATPPQGVPASTATVSDTTYRRPEPGTTKLGGPDTTAINRPSRTVADARTAVVGAPPPPPKAQLDSFRRSLDTRHQQMMALDELAILGLDASSSDVDVLHAYLRTSEEWRPVRYEGHLSEDEMTKVREVAARLDRAYNEMGDLVRRRRLMGDPGTGPVQPKTHPIPPRTGAIPHRPEPPSSFPKEKTTASAIYAQGAEAMRAGRFLEAKERFQHAVTMEPRTAEYHFRLGQAVLRLGDGNGHTDWVKVETCYQTALDLAPDNIEILLGMAKQWQLRGQTSVAMKYYKRIRDIDADQLDASREIRLYLMRKKKEDKTPTPTSRLLGFLGRKQS